ncbi:LytTR family DNA-binding domain-containing protein [Xanthomarina sp.]|uniref:LytR/AlgR family response regulator transcription factor n=1 Tax=Xanthomarina sp. TaxID=1931211 RepID=UPI002C30EEDC|nr:LytTR family DNA-binding domain-containing protein [Xanthomarina sp.]HLV38183.1 LytTR family DNA-binding domain-containing protein [Xanthomarina sp.]
MKALIIDDENKARRLLQRLLEEECKEIDAIFQASDLLEGIAIIEKEQPDIVYLDIEMPKYSGLQILEFFEGKPVSFQIIFTTAYSNYAIEAFKLSAIDYLMKPIDVQELKQATTKAIEVAKAYTINHKLEDLKKAFSQLALNKLVVEVPNGMLFISFEDVILFEADGMYTTIYLKDKTTELICKPLKHFVEQLHNQSYFYKPHRSYLINLKHIKAFSNKDGYHLIMQNNKTVPVSKTKKEEFETIIKQVFNN